MLPGVGVGQQLKWRAGDADDIVRAVDAASRCFRRRLSNRPMTPGALCKQDRGDVFVEGDSVGLGGCRRAGLARRLPMTGGQQQNGC
jgi:hypothetical protein